jgi:dipeptidyl aminopeptidase/acylaminoacyl peptidase
MYKTSSFLLFLTLTLLTYSSSALSYSQGAQVLPISAYGDLPQYNQVKLSPNGKNLALLKNINGSLFLIVVDIKTGAQQHILQSDNLKITLNWYTWANNDVLLFSAGYSSRQGSVKYTETRLYKHDLTSDEGMSLVVKPRVSRKENLAQFQDNIISLLPNEPDSILMAIDYDKANSPSVYKINLKTKQRLRIKKYKSYITDWYSDQQGKIRVALGKDETRIFYRLYDKNGEIVRDLWTYQVFEKDVVHILGFDSDPNILYISALHQGRYAVFKVNIHDKDLNKELVLADSTYDVDGSLIYSPKTGGVIGIHHGSGDDNKTYWNDEYMALKAGLNAVMPDANNTIVSMSHDLKKYILFSSSNKEPGAYFLGDRNEGSLTFLAGKYPQINNTNYATKKLVKYKARDGLEIEGYLTKPINHKEGSKLPAIILPHGGPMARDYAGFDYWAELFANRGYVVFQPNFRGSSGYGYEFEMASIQGWGKAMQDDLQDAVHWLKDQNIINEKKVCIAGASYGGYAALMAAVKHSDTFQCAASFAGVSDIEMIVSKARHFTNKEVVRKQFGTDSDKLEAVSPVNFAKHINIPILLIHGTDDKVVPVIHSRDMADELEDFDKEVKYVEIEEANHHLSVQKHRIQVLKEMLAFFDKHLK